MKYYVNVLHAADKTQH